MTNLFALSDFDSAAKSLLKYLRNRTELDLWMVTRADGPDQVVLQSDDTRYGVAPGSVFPWADSLCSRMVRGDGPRVAADCSTVTSYAAAPFGRRVAVGAYIGVPLARADGSLFGTICGFHPTPMPDRLVEEQPLLELLASLLSGVLASDLRVTELTRVAERAKGEATTDVLTGLVNRRGWDDARLAEESRCARYGHPACVVAIDIDGLKRLNHTAGHGHGDDLLRRAATAIRRTIREHDVAARVGDNEFAVLGVECNEAGSRALRDRLAASLIKAGVEASIGLARRHATTGLDFAAREAELAMDRDKCDRRAAQNAFTPAPVVNPAIVHA